MGLTKSRQIDLENALEGYFHTIESEIGEWAPNKM
jgi:hypothetical protein